jgi:predicted FMN-binding regulatory protein PaiB
MRRGSPIADRRFVAGRVPWQSVRRIEAKSVGTRRYLVVQVYRPQRFIADLDPERRKAAEELIQRHGTPIVIPWEALDQPLNAVVEQAEALRQSTAT